MADSERKAEAAARSRFCLVGGCIRSPDASGGAWHQTVTWRFRLSKSAGLWSDLVNPTTVRSLPAR